MVLQLSRSLSLGLADERLEADPRLVHSASHELVGSAQASQGSQSATQRPRRSHCKGGGSLECGGEAVDEWRDFNLITLDALGLEPKTYAIAAELVVECPYVRFTDGLRTLTDQAQRMAQNTVRRRDWIALTYIRSRPVDELIAWVKSHPSATTENALVSGFLPILRHYTTSELRHVSKHLSGEAFDVQPEDGVSGEKICSVLRQKALSYGGRFLEKEGGMRIWHFQL